MSTKINHVHQLKRHEHPNGVPIYFCALPDCLFKIEVKLALGKKCICWRCGREFILTPDKLRLARPHCDDCSRRKTVVNGEVKYVYKPEKPPVAAEMISNTVNELKTRLTAVTKEMPNDGDI